MQAAVLDLFFFVLLTVLRCIEECSIVYILERRKTPLNPRLPFRLFYNLDYQLLFLFSPMVRIL